MKISLNSNRSFMIKPLLPVIAFIPIVCILMSIALGLNFDMQKDSVLYLILLILFEFILIIFILIAKFLVWKRYEFTENEIICFRRRTKVDIIEISDIIGISYYQFKFRYIITIFAGALNEGGCWKLHIKMKDGVKKELCFFSVKDVKLLQEKLYGDLITIY